MRFPHPLLAMLDDQRTLHNVYAVPVKHGRKPLFYDFPIESLHLYIGDFPATDDYRRETP